MLDDMLEEETFCELDDDDEEKVDDEDMDTFLTEDELTLEEDCWTLEEDCWTEDEDDCWTEDDCCTDEDEEVRAPEGWAASPSRLGALTVRTPSLERAVATASMLAQAGMVNSL